MAMGWAGLGKWTRYGSGWISRGTWVKSGSRDMEKGKGGTFSHLDISLLYLRYQD